MDNDGWIPVQLLANFRRVRIHTGTVNVELIVEFCLHVIVFVYRECRAHCGDLFTCYCVRVR